MDIKNYSLYLLDKLFKRPNINNGFIEVQPKLEDYQYEEIFTERERLSETISKIILNLKKIIKYA